MNGLFEKPPATIRERILEHLIARFRDAQAGYGGRYMTWQTVKGSPVTSGDMSPTIAIYDGRERKTVEVGYVRCVLEVQTEFKAALALGDDAHAFARSILGEVEAVMLSDIYCTEGSMQLSLNIVEVGNELDVDGPDDQSVAGIVFWEIQYRHKAHDPRKRQGE